MLRILAPGTDNTERVHGGLCYAPRLRSAGNTGIQKPTRSLPVGSITARTREPMDLKSLSARKTAPGSHTLTQATKNAATPSTSHISKQLLPVPNSIPKRANSIAPSKASMPTWYDDSNRQGHDTPRLTKTPWEVERYKKNSTWRRLGPKAEFPERIFRNLPREVYNSIVTQLEQIHLVQDQACVSCYLKDLHSLSLTSRAWDRTATLQMYQKVYVIGHDDQPQSSNPRVKGPSRLKLLRRTLRERHMLARHVRELHVPDFQILYQQASIEREDVINLVASLVMSCPSLERLVGFHVPFTQSFDRLSYALSTRPKLRERVWLFTESEDDYLDREYEDEANNYYLAALDPTERFLDLNSGHPLLTTLVLHRKPGEHSPTLNFRAIVGTFRQLPMLQHLFISCLPATSFTNLALNALPPQLKSLRLENLPGINDKGLQRFANSHLSTSIERLTLINLELSSLITITSLLSEQLSNLKHFAIVQYKTPGLGPRISIPDFSCPSLQFIHFEFRSQSRPAIDPFPTNSQKFMEFPFANPEPISCLATSLLATNIKEGAFPMLRRVRVPHDPQGVIQALCKPLATALLPSDTSIFMDLLQKSGIHSTTLTVDAHVPQPQALNHQESSSIAPLSPRADSAIDSPTFDSKPSSSSFTPPKTRLAAQARILAARKAPFLTVRVYDPEGQLRIDTAIGGFIGDIKSNITYDLKPDKGRWPGSHDQNGPPQPEWITGIEDLADERTPPNGGSRERFWGNCGHLVGGRVGCDTVRVEELV